MISWHAITVTLVTGMRGKAMTVYAVSIGENHEGGRIDKIFASLARARSYCRDHKILNSGGWSEIDFCDWSDGCNFMIIEKIKVEA